MKYGILFYYNCYFTFLLQKERERKKEREEGREKLKIYFF